MVCFLVRLQYITHLNLLLIKAFLKLLSHGICDDSIGSENCGKIGDSSLRSKLFCKKFLPSDKGYKNALDLDHTWENKHKNVAFYWTWVSHRHFYLFLNSLLLTAFFDDINLMKCRMNTKINSWRKVISSRLNKFKTSYTFL